MPPRNKPRDIYSFPELSRYFPRSGWTGKRAHAMILKRRRTIKMLYALHHDELHALSASIGFVEISWAMMEQHLDHAVHSIWNNVPGAKVIEKEVPRTSYSRKSAFLSKAVKKLALLHKYQKETLALLDKTDKMADKRNDLTHAVIDSLYPTKGAYHMTIFEVKQGVRQMRRIRFVGREFPKLALDLVRSGRGAIHLAAKLRHEFGQ